MWAGDGSEWLVGWDVCVANVLLMVREWLVGTFVCVLFTHAQRF
jgi:hypothetical protein